MSETVKHTPGPWKAVRDHNWDNGFTYVSVQPVTADPDTMRPLLMANGEYHVCRMSHTAAMHRVNLHYANARLIAAAPELLDVANRILDRGYVSESIEEERADYLALSAAIAKAGGSHEE